MDSRKLEQSFFFGGGIQLKGRVIVDNRQKECSEGEYWGQKYRCGYMGKSKMRGSAN